MEWNDILQFHKNSPGLQLKRHPYVQRDYNRHRMMNKDYVKDLRKSLFSDKSVEWVLNENTYPYHFIDNTKHYIYWSKVPIIEEDMVTILDGMNKKYIYFENSPNNRSIPSIYHYHIFFRS
jgi:hypothetical protein